MTSTANRQRKVKMPIDIRKKFAAAICMLLIAAIMMISSTYAWFTLSTAPEVTGITTNVGANGNLEIALLNEDSFTSNLDDLGIETGVGDSMEVKDKLLSNVTWGNLIDLSDASYGLENIILNPAALNIKLKSAGAEKLDGCLIQGGLSKPLLAPNYGADGRVIDVQKQTTVGVYNKTTRKFEEAVNSEQVPTGAGVRAVGVSANITLRVSEYRNALAKITTYMSAAKTAAQASLVNNGQDVATLLVTGIANSAYKLSQDDVDAIEAVKDDLLDATDAIANAIRQAALAKYLSGGGAGELTDEQVATKVTAFSEASLSSLATLADPVSISFLSDAISAYTELVSRINNIEVEAEQPYSEAASQVYELINRQNIKINGINGNAISSDELGPLVSAIMNRGKVEITMLDDSGVYADIADIVGNYTASGLYITVSYGSLNVDNMPTVMATEVTSTPMLLTAKTAAAGGDPSAAGGAMAVDDTYGYMIDMAVRTNAAGSNLLLEQNGKQRIYSDGSAALTQGDGSFVEFNTADRYKFTEDDMKALMSAMRVVFLTPGGDGYEILAIAAPNLKTSLNNATGVRTTSAADDRITDTYTYVEATEENNTTAKMTAKLYLYDLSDASVTEYIEGKEYGVTLGKIKTKTTDEGLKADLAITALDQNKAKKICALVYLDGDIVDNTMVANAAVSMNGKVNFQFGSDATLVPMENKALRQNGTEEGGAVNNNPATLSVTKEQLSEAVTAIKADNEVYVPAKTAYDAGSADDKQTELCEAVISAEGVLTESDATAEMINSAASTLGLAYAAAGGTNPFSA